MTLDSKIPGCPLGYKGSSDVPRRAVQGAMWIRGTIGTIMGITTEEKGERT